METALLDSKIKQCIYSVRGNQVMMLFGEKSHKWTELEIPDEKLSSFSKPSIVFNRRPLSNLKVWVIGDSFSLAQRAYFNATFREIHYLGHWGDKLRILADELKKSKDKPDIVFVIRVERSF